MLNENVSIRGIFMTQNTNSFSKLSADVFLKDTSYLNMVLFYRVDVKIAIDKRLSIAIMR